MLCDYQLGLSQEQCQLRIVCFDLLVSRYPLILFSNEGDHLQLLSVVFPLRNQRISLFLDLKVTPFLFGVGCIGNQVVQL